jgi:hypothetical protein
MQNRILRIDPLQSPQDKSAPSRTKEIDRAARPPSVLDILLAGKAMLNRIDEYHRAPAPDPFQENWNRFRLAIVAAEALPGVQFMASSLPIPNLEIVDQLFLQNVVIRLASILDEKLEEVVDTRVLPIGKKPKLSQRIDAVRDAGLITNGTATDLHSMRDLRNKIGHKVDPPVLGFPTINLVADYVEQAFLELGVTTKSPEFKVEEMILTHLESSELQYEIGRREVVLPISADGSPFCSFRWPYVYFIDPAWKP